MTSKRRATVGFIGLGAMGAAMAANLQKAGHPLVVNDLRREAARAHCDAGARWAASPRAVAAMVDVVFTCLPTLEAVETVALGPEGVLDGLRAGQAMFEMSTSTPGLVQRLHAAFETRNAHFLDAPISGGAEGARQRRLAIWVGGDLGCYARFESVLRAMGDCPMHVGAVGSGLVTKLVHNCCSQATQAAMVEAFVMGVKAGAKPLAIWKAVRQGAIGRRRTFDGLANEVLPAMFDKTDALLPIMHKDMLVATDLGRELGVPMPFANLALADLEEAVRRGWSDKDGRCVALLPQERAGVRMEVDIAEIQAVLRHDPSTVTDRQHTDKS